MDYRKTCLTFLLCYWLSCSGYAMELDSLGIEIRDGHAFVLHRVESQETLYGLSRRYHSSIEAIKSSNQITGDELPVGAVISIPWSQALVHKVKQGETLYTLSRIYSVSVREIKQWNDLRSNDLEVDRLLRIGKTTSRQEPDSHEDQPATPSFHIVSGDETLYSIGKKYGVSLQDLQTWNQLTDYNVRIGDRLLLSPPGVAAEIPNEIPEPVQQAEEETPDLTPRPPEGSLTAEKSATSSNPKHIGTVMENGLAAVIEGNYDTKKYLALHRTAPPGTIMQVRNEMTKLNVFVRVVGKLPDTGANNNIILRLSKAAQEALGALDDKFRVELSYIPDK